MRIEENIINVIFDAAKGKTPITTKEAVQGNPVGTLPQPTRTGYAFEGWYLGDLPVTAETVLNEDEDIRLVARWSKKAVQKKKSQMARQKLASVILVLLAVVLTVTFVSVNFVENYSLMDTYYDAEGGRHTNKYFVKKKNGSFGLYYKNGKPVEQNSDGYYIVDGGNQYEVNPETGEASLYAAVDFEIEGEETELYQRVLMFPQIKQKNVLSIEVNNEYGRYRFYKDEDGKVKIEGSEDSAVSYNQELYAGLCVSCGYTLAMKKLNMNAEDILRLPDGSVDYSAFGLSANDKFSTYTITGTVEEGGSKKEVSYTVKIGSKILSGGGYYVQLEGRNTVYVLSSNIASTILQPIENLITPMVLYQSTMANHLLVQDFILSKVPGNIFGDDGNLTLEKENVVVAFSAQDLEERTNTLLSYRPYVSQNDLMKGYELNGNNVSTMLGNLYGIQYLSCVKLGFSRADLEKYGLDKDVFYLDYWTRIETDTSTGDTTIVNNSVLISQKTDRGTYYMASMEYDMIVEVDQYYLSFLEWEMKDWYDPQFYPHDISYLKEIHITLGGKQFDFRLDNSLSYAYYIENGKATFPDFTKGTLSLDSNGNYVYHDQYGKKVNFKVIDFENGEFRTNASGDAVYMDGDVEVKLKVISTNLLVFCDQYNKGTMVVDLLDYKHVYSYVNDVGETVTKSYTGIENFRQFCAYLLNFNIVGDFDAEEFKENMGVDYREYIARGDSVCDAMISYRVEDLAKFMNLSTYRDEAGNVELLYPKNNSQEVVLRFYNFSPVKTLMTLEVIEKYDAEGNPISDPTRAVAAFYVWDSYLDVLEDALDGILAEDRVIQK